MLCSSICVFIPDVGYEAASDCPQQLDGICIVLEKFCDFFCQLRIAYDWNSGNSSEGIWLPEPPRVLAVAVPPAVALCC